MEGKTLDRMRGQSHRAEVVHIVGALAGIAIRRKEQTALHGDRG